MAFVRPTLPAAAACAALLLVPAACGGSSEPAGAAGSAASGGIPTAPALGGKPLPELTLRRLDTGDAVRTSDLAGRPAVVNLWFSTCVPCKQEMPAFEEVHRAVGDRVRFVGLNTGEAAAPAKRFLAEQVSVTYEQWHDPQADLATALRIPSFPATLLLSAQGRVVKAHYGALDAGRLRSLIAEVTA